MRTGAILLALAILAAVSRRLLDVVEVRGDSMKPTLHPGDRLLVARLRPRVGDVALAADPREPRREMVKRIAATGPHGITLRGDNPRRSTDARAFGALDPAAVRWRAVLRYWPVGRAGILPAAPAALTVVDEGGEAACTFPQALIAGDVVAS